MPEQVRVLHVHDAAMVASNLVDVARELGHPWSRVDIPWYYRRDWNGLAGRLVRIMRRHVWDADLAIRSQAVDVVHLHTGQLSLHTRWLRSPWLLHLHGTDIRTNQYLPRWERTIRYGVERAHAVVYSTPDLREHVERLTDRAVYLPVTVRLDQAPTWRPVEQRIVFSSRWDSVKGAAQQIQVARELRRLAPDAEILGLDWGSETAEAEAAGVVLVPRMDYNTYRSWLASASVVVGQMHSILAASELEALAIGVPLFGGASPEFYPGLVHLSGTAPEEIAAAAVSALADPQGASELQKGREYIAAVHDARNGVESLLRLYGQILGGARISGKS